MRVISELKCKFEGGFYWEIKRKTVVLVLMTAMAATMAAGLRQFILRQGSSGTREHGGRQRSSRRSAADSKETEKGLPQGKAEIDPYLCGTTTLHLPVYFRDKGIHGKKLSGCGSGRLH